MTFLVVTQAYCILYAKNIYLFFIATGKCLPYGLLDVSDCYYGFPIALSYPHFLDCDESLADNIIGTKPNRSEHETYFMIQPVSKIKL